MPEVASLIRQLRVPSGQGNGMPDIDEEHDLERSGHGTGFLRNWRCETAIVTVADAEFRLPRRQRLELLDDALLVRACCSGDCSYTVDSGVTWQYGTAAVTLDAIPRGTILEIDIAANVRQQGITVLIDPRGVLAMGDDVLPERLRRLCESPIAAAEQLLTMPMSAEILSLVYDLRHSRLPAVLRRMQMATRASELIMLALAEWSARLDDTQEPGLHGRDADLLAAARHALLERCTNPPTTVVLARELGTNKNKLNRLFRDRFDTTPQGYALYRRMELARSLIASGRMTFGQVADAVGYQHQSSFTTAFRQAMGVSPREYANRAALAAAH